MKKISELIWPIVGLAAVVVSGYLLYRELRGISLAEIGGSLAAIPVHRFLLAGVATLVAYAALAWYDRIALLHLGVTHISVLFVSVCSFTTYALSHNIGASVFSGAVVRYRAYTAKGLSAAQVAVLVALCSFTFGLGTILLGGFVLVALPDTLTRLQGYLPAILTNPATARILGAVLLGAVALYMIGSLLRLRPLTVRAFKLEYPRPRIMVRQIIAAPLELLGAAGIIYFALPEANNPGFLVVLAVFLASFSAALVSNAPGGLGVFELVFVIAMPDMERPSIIAALLVFRMFYFWLPFLISVVVVLLYERGRLVSALGKRAKVPVAVPEPPLVVPGLDAHEIEQRLEERAV
ncbi:lysylphosphatidylglycerol synthase domain-containing protein [uncultured Methylobacterium sp.]|uniref:lysylphosphatidylglycerol synthase domain-containing protein n=1 Tax=uncultured Methylobacterium sp. TaxID=157278 RepID=UPI0035CA0E86